MHYGSFVACLLAGNVVERLLAGHDEKRLLSIICSILGRNKDRRSCIMSPPPDQDGGFKIGRTNRIRPREEASPGPIGPLAKFDPLESY
jgi:hypothetical protein